MFEYIPHTVTTTIASQTRRINTSLNFQPVIDELHLKGILVHMLNN